MKRGTETEGGRATVDEGEGEDLEFEDEYGDEFEEEIMVEEGEEDQMEEAALGSDGIVAETAGKLWRAGDAMAADEELDFDSSAYTMLHRMNLEWPCMTFGVVQDNLGMQRTRFPLTAYLVAGTQAETASQNKLVCMKLSHLTSTRHDDSEDDDDDDDEADDDPIVEQQEVAHDGTVNRLRLMPKVRLRAPWRRVGHSPIPRRAHSTLPCGSPSKPQTLPPPPQASHICATWAETGKVHIYDLSAQLATLHQPGSGGTPNPKQKPVFTFAGHKDEGFALDFSEPKPGALATGDCASGIHVWSAGQAGSWAVDAEPYAGHTASVEDIAWSPVEVPSPL